MKKIIKYFIPLLIFFVGFKVNAVGIVYLTCDNNGCEVVNRCDNQYFCQSPLLNSNEIQFNFDNANYEIDSTYNFNLNFTTTSPALYGTPNIYDCNLAINGAFVVATRNSGRTGYECGSDRCDASFVSSMSYTMTQSLSNVPSFIRCQMNTTRYNYTQFTYSSNSNKGSVIKAINDNGNNQIQTANNNAQQNNANRDSNTNRLISKLGDVISGITNTGSDIVSGIVSGINSAKNFMLNKMSDIITAIGDIVSPITTAVGNIVSPIVNAVTTIGSNIVTAIGNGVTGIVNKLGEFIGTQEVCTTYYKTNGDVVEYGDSYTTGRLSSEGQLLTNTTSYGTSPYLPISRTSFYYSTNLADTNSYVCFYLADKTYQSCQLLDSTNKTFNNSSGYSYVRYSFRLNRGYTTNLRGDCQRTGIAGLFNKFTQFLRDLFNPNVDNANSLGSSEFTNFTTTNVGLRGLLDTLVSFVQNIFSQSCSALVVPIPFVDDTVTLPCMSSIYSTYFPTFFSLYQLITTGLISYRVIINLFHKVHQLEDVNYDKVEVLDL